jgi:uncharacterized protein (DUF983 family)
MSNSKSLPVAKLSLWQHMVGRCPRCGNGPLYSGLLGLRTECSSCQLDYRQFDTADGPAVFAMTIVGFLVVAGVLILELAVKPPIWLHVAIWLPLSIAACLAVLRPLKSALVFLEYKNSARQGDMQDPSNSTEHIK